MKLYGELASWFHLLTAPEEYADEARFYRLLITEASHGSARTVLELGSGGGNNASHLKKHFVMTLTDLSPEMLDLSRTLNPECGHVRGDMRTIRLGRTFDAVFAHDAIAYLTDRSDLRAAMKTAFVHCRPGGVALFVPDYVRERFVPSTTSTSAGCSAGTSGWSSWKRRDSGPRCAPQPTKGQPGGEIFLAMRPR